MYRTICRFALLLTLFALLPASLRAAPARAARSAAWGDDTLVLRNGSGAAASFVTQSVRDYGATATQLPLGLLDRTGRTLYAVTGGGSTLKVIDTLRGQMERQMKLPGTFSTRSGDYAVGSWPLLPSGVFTTSAPSLRAVAAGMVAGDRPLQPARAAPPADGSQVLSALSFTGRWLALRATDTADGNSTRFIVVDTARMRIVADVTLDGDFGLDAIGADGRMLYLIQEIANNYDYYHVRSYDVARKVLDKRVVVAPDDARSPMHGVAWTRAWSPDGSWLYTLYVQDNSHVFVHALDLATRETHCIDFPAISGASATSITHFTLSVAPDGRALYAVNPALGLVAVARDLPDGAVMLHQLGAHAGAPERTQTAAAIARDGKTVFVATGSGVWVVDTRALAIRAVYVPDEEVASVALSHDGFRLYILSVTSQQLDSVDIDGSALDGLQYSPGTWAIEGIADGTPA